MGRVAVALLAAFALAGGVDGAAARDADCDYDLANVSSAPEFSDYSVAPHRAAHPTMPRLDSPEARLFRTVVRKAAAQGPNFAGRDTIAVWGCGISCTSAAIIDGTSGRVSFPAAIGAVMGNHVAGREPNGAEPAYNSLRFKPDSRLLAVLGAPGEDGRRDGVAFYVWAGGTLKPLRFVPRSTLCASPG